MSWFTHRGARENLHGENGGKGRFIYLAQALDRCLDPDYIRDEGRERERNMLHFLVLLLIPAKIAIGVMLAYWLLQLLLR